MPINGDTGTSNYEFTLSFVTIGNPASESTITYLIEDHSMQLNYFGPNYDNGGPIGFLYNNQFKFFKLLFGKYSIECYF